MAGMRRISKTRAVAGGTKLWSGAMKPFNDNRNSERWTGEPDAVAAISLAACLAAAALIFLLMAAMELHP